MSELRPTTTSLRLWRILCAIWIVVIWLHSCLGGQASAQESGVIVRTLEPLFVRMGVDAPQLMNFIVRKTAHVLEYAFLGLLLVKSRNPERSLKHSFVWLFALLVPLIDETIQRFSPGRSSSLWDVLLDACSCVVAIVLVYYQARRRSA